jgi:hypothetical protein
MKTLSQAAISCIKVKYAFDYAEKCGVSVKGLFSPYAQYGSIYARLNAIKFAISRKDEAYSRLKNNYLLNHLAPVLRDAKKDTLIVDGKTTSVPQFVSVLNGISESKMSSDMFIESWNDLLNDQDENIRTFARDLIIYALVSSGDYKGFNKLAKYIPFEWMIETHGDL